jgi:hypothetical protein
MESAMRLYQRRSAIARCRLPVHLAVPDLPWAWRRGLAAGSEVLGRLTQIRGPARRSATARVKPEVRCRGWRTTCSAARQAQAPPAAAGRHARWRYPSEPSLAGLAAPSSGEGRVSSSLRRARRTASPRRGRTSGTLPRQWPRDAPTQPQRSALRSELKPTCRGSSLQHRCSSASSYLAQQESAS